ncbi:LysM peptidoglycan-binding domain-containing protein [Agarilytica rhodophyticola]|uniref:LysM peptidoglycan-binding domain-containing protein n=1 Tax=Agarilytica rhodophyticola TaxID=1737490 RepID=UPI000B3436C1|nr:LysM peptidoglycan-binding domain-containing protein [Agarilytica rhodophyticola]
MKKILLSIFAIVLTSLPTIAFVNAEEPILQDNVPDTHTVVKGDTLWDISGRFLKNPWMWPEIWHVNAQIENPHLIYPGDVIRLVYLSGQPRLTVDRSGRVFKLSPKARILTAEEAIDTIPLDKINSFLSRSRIVGEEELKTAPYVVAGKDENLIAGAGDEIYIRGDLKEKFAVYGIYRPGEMFIDPETREKLGMQALDIGSGEVSALNGEISTLEVSRTTEEIRIGDRLLEQEERSIDSTFFPSAPVGPVEGVILAVEGGVRLVGKMDVVVINRGEREGIQAGNVMAVYKRGNRIRDRISQQNVTLPDERAGLVMVFRVFEKLSFALVLEAEKGIKVNDKVKNP